VEELLAAGVDTASAVPASIAELTARRLAVLAPSTRRCVEAAAVLGEQFDWQVLVHLLAEVDRGTDVVAALREATAAGLVDPVNAEEFRFHHVLARDAVLQSILPPDLSRWARHALAAVVAVHPQLDGVWCEIAADLAVRAGDANRAAEVLLEAGRRNLGRGALASAEAVLRRARGLVEDGATPTAELDDLLAEVLAQAGKPTDAVDVATRSIERLRRAGAPGRTLAEAHLRLARIHITAGTWHAADEHLDAAGAHPVDDAVRLRIEAARAHAALGDSRLDEARRAAERVLRGTGNGTDLAEVACDALLVLGRLARRDDLAAAEALLTRARLVADRAGLSIAATRAVEELAIVDAQESLHLDRLQEARARAARHGDIATVAVLDLQLTATRLSKWEPDQALAAADRCIAASRRFALPTLPKALALGGVAADCLGDPARSAAAYAEALRLAPDDTHLRGEISGARAYLRLQSADDARALDDLREAMSWFARRPNEVTGSPAVGLWVLLSTVADADRPEPPAPPDPVVTRWNRGLVAFAEAVARGRRGDTAGAESAFAAADATMRSPVDIAWNRMQARRLVAAAALADGWGRPAEWATEDLPGIDRRGLTGWAAALRGLIRRAGGTVPRRGHATGTVPDHLRALGITARETEVLLLVGEGITNHEIARRLFLSPRTVEKHVEHLMTKTSVNRRIELVAYAARALVSAYHGQSRDPHSRHPPG
jgi:DNA-binding CsgD family transcriptional regulator/tetratricopeptide (TPR) repeat protein